MLNNVLIMFLKAAGFVEVWAEILNWDIFLFAALGACDAPFARRFLLQFHDLVLNLLVPFSLLFPFLFRLFANGSGPRRPQN